MPRPPICCAPKWQIGIMLCAQAACNIMLSDAQSASMALFYTAMRGQDYFAVRSEVSYYAPFSRWRLSDTVAAYRVMSFTFLQHPFSMPQHERQSNANMLQGRLRLRPCRKLRIRHDRCRIIHQLPRATAADFLNIIAFSAARHHFGTSFPSRCTGAAMPFTAP